jgi:aryl-alcohol dehydrogenase
VKIRAAVARAAHQDFVLEDLDLAPLRAEDVLVEIRGVGLCHTDIAARDGVYGLHYPIVLGHEGSGVVVAVGTGVTSIVPGDEVALSFSSCGTCRTCTTGRSPYCEHFTEENYIGSRPDGSNALSASGTEVHGHFFGQSSFSTHAVATERNVVKVESELDVSLLGPLGCGIQTGAGAVMRSMACTPGSTLVVLGAGPVGLAAVMGAVLQGCTTIIVVEPLASRRDVALELGATDVVDPADGPIDDQILAVAKGGTDYVFDTSGRVEVIEGAIRAVGPNAVVGLVGVPSDFSVDLPVNIVAAMQRGLTVKGIVEGDSNPKEFIPELLEHHRAGRFPFDRLITTFKLSEINEAVAAQHRGEVTKVVLIPDTTPTPDPRDTP